MEDEDESVVVEPVASFSSLRSRFEQLATSNNPASTKIVVARGDNARVLSAGPSSDARQRTVSSTEPDSKIAQVENAESSSIQALRTSASSSDLRRRPPPPPPPLRNGSPAISPSPVGSVSDLTAENAGNGLVPALKTTYLQSPSPSPAHTPLHTQRPSQDLTGRDSKYALKSESPSNSSDIAVLSPESTSRSASSTSLLLGRKPPVPIHSRPTIVTASPVIGVAETHNSASSATSYGTDSSIEVDYARARPPPPPPPSRQPKTSVESALNTTDPDILKTHKPPPLPSRQLAVTEELPAPRLPMRPSKAPEPTPSIAQPVARTAERLLPPPIRTIGPGEKLPAVRRASTPLSSDEDEDAEEDDDPRAKAIDKLPDSSATSRLPPRLTNLPFSTGKIQVPAHSGKIRTAGPRVVVARSQHLSGYDLSVDNHALWNLDKRDLRLKDNKITCMEFRPAQSGEDQGVCLWLGTKEGHLTEVDCRSGLIKQTKSAAHGHAISYLFRYGRSMLSVDVASGKCNVFFPFADEDVNLMQMTPTVKRLPEKQDWISLIDTLLWCATRPEGIAGVGGVQRPASIRIFDPFNSTGASKALIVPVTENLGAVTSGTTMRTQPGKVFLGHEGGSVSIWDTVTATPTCIEVVKISSSDILCLTACHDRLWAGGRKGYISAYDVAPRPWIMTNAWLAHDGSPVTHLAVDPFSIDKMHQLSVVSVGRDESVQVWDGLFSQDWIQKEIGLRDASLSRLRDITVLVVSWNLDAALPDSLTGDDVNLSFLDDVLNSVDSPDIITFGFQEIINLEDRGLTAKNVLYGGLKRLENPEDGRAPDKISGAYSRWTDKLVSAVRNAMDPKCPYEKTINEAMVGLYSCSFVKTSERVSLRDKSTSLIKRGMGGRYGNKGAVLHRFVIDDSSICFINCHLAAGQHHVRQRNADLAAVFEQAPFPPVTSFIGASPYVGGGDGTMIMDHELIFVYGDMNYRIEGRREQIIAQAEAGELESLLARDQLLKQLRYNHSFRLQSFHEGSIHFSPTYKYDRRSNQYDSSEKARRPAWCDRILWHSRDRSRVMQLHYKRWEANVSDHRPISAAFKVTVKSIRHDGWKTVQLEVESIWERRLMEILAGETNHYTNLALI